MQRSAVSVTRGARERAEEEQEDVQHVQENPGRERDRFFSAAPAQAIEIDHCPAQCGRTTAPTSKQVQSDASDARPQAWYSPEAEPARRPRPRFHETRFHEEGGACACSILANAYRPLGRAAAALELAATSRRLREAKRQPLTDDCDIRARDCVPMHGRVRACSRSMAQQTGTTAVGLELGSNDGLDGTIGFDGKQSRPAGHRDYRFDQRTARGRAIAMPRQQ